MGNLIYIVGIGPGDEIFLTGQARRALEDSDVIIGYNVYVDLVKPVFPDKEYMTTGMPLVERVVTVSGENMAKPANYMVRIGTNVADVIEHCGGIKGDDVTIKLGGFMMGVPITDTNTSVVKGTNGIIAYETDHTVPVECIKCGRCADVCPMELKPLYFAKFSDAGDANALKEYHLMDCMECGCCQYICSSKIPLVTKIKAGKKLVREMK